MGNQSNIDTPTAQTLKIRQLNDRLRCEGRGGELYVTNGIISLGKGHLLFVIEAVKAFSVFTADNDPHAEHDFGSLDYHGNRIMWKIDYYNWDGHGGSEDPSDEAQTKRVLTIMLAAEY